MLLAAGESSHLAGPDYFILVGYFVIMLGVGAYFWGYMKGMSDYFSGRHQIPWWLSGVSFYMTSFSAFLFVAYSELAFRKGLVAVTVGWAVVPAVLIGVIVVSGRWRRARINSPAEYLEERFGLGLRQTFAWANVIVRMIDDGLKVYATGLFLSKSVGLGLGESIACTGLITLAYTFMGGLWAVAVTDFVQFVVMLAGAAVLLPMALVRVGWLGGLVDHAPPGFFSLTAGPDHSWWFLGGWFLLLVCNYNTSFGLVQRYYCVRDEREARKVGYLVAVLCLVGTPIYFIPAMCARQFMPDAVPGSIYAALCVELLPVGLLGLVVAAMFSATMSTLSGDYNVVAAVLTNDVYHRLIDRQASERRLVTVGRACTLVVGLVPIAIGLCIAYLIGNDLLFSWMVKLFSVASPPIAIPMLAGILWRRCSNAGALAGFLGGLGVGLGLFFCGLKDYQIAAATTAATLIEMVVVSLLVTPGEPELRGREGVFRRLDAAVSREELAAERGGPSPFRIVGLSTIAIALMLLLVMPFVPWSSGSIVNLAIAIGLFVPGVIWMRQSGLELKEAGRES
ncbi:MAG TPA: hypothetical protein PKY77_02455 [Phycisphaerae bacterium]|nr:hypothetical protein [Phycisphaerae bacterium]HRY66605.1 hypothetical protein [Phycisphaerae bacterium]HSA27025.1 hypothetical protein [Phycisphaerae bacterium]